MSAATSGDPREVRPVIVIMKPKMRLVSVRMSQDEYEHLKSFSSVWGGGSVSGLIRASMRGIMLNGNRNLIDLLCESSPAGGGVDLAAPISAIQGIERRLENLDREIKRLGEGRGNAWQFRNGRGNQ
jgi:hypothetical protein